MPYMTANSYWGVAKEATYGAAASPTTWDPIGSPKVTPGLKWLDDSDFRGSPVMHYDQVPGVRGDQFSGKTFMYSDTYPLLLKGVLGGVDSLSSSVHTIGLLNSPTTGSQAPSYTVWNDSVDGMYQLTGSRIVDLSLSFSAEAAVETTFSYAGNPASVVASTATVSESTQHLVPSWSVTAAFGATASAAASVAVVESGTLDIKRNTAPIFTIGQQAPYNNFQGPLDVSGTLKFVVEAGETYYANALARAQQALVLTFTDPATGYYVKFQMSAVQLEDPVIDQSKAFVSVDTKFIAVANTTDAVSASGGGYSPILTSTYNSVASQY